MTLASLAPIPLRNPHLNHRHVQLLITTGTLAGAIVAAAAPQMTTLGLSINVATNLAWIWIESDR